MKPFSNILLIALACIMACTNLGCRESPKPTAPMQPAVTVPMLVAAPPSPPLATVNELPPDKPEGAYKRLGSNALRTRAVKRLAITPDGDFIATLNVNDELEVWSVKTGRRVWMRDKDNGGMGQTLAFSSDGKLLATGGWESDVRFFRTSNGEAAHSDFFLPSYIASVAFSPDGQYFAAVSFGSIEDLLRGKAMPSVDPSAAPNENESRNKLFIWRTGSLESDPIVVIPSVKGIDHALRFSPDSSQIAVGTLADRVEVFDVESGQRIHNYEKHKLQVASLAYSENSELMVSASRSWLRPDYPGEVNLWDVASGDLKHQWHYTDMHLVDFSGDLMIGAGTQGVVRLWQLTPTIEQLPVLAWHKYWITGLAIASNKTELGASADQGGVIHVWNTKTGKTLDRGDTHEGSVMRLQFTANGKTLISLGGDGAIRIWDVTSGKSTKVIVPFKRAVPDLRGHSIGASRLAPYGNEMRVGLLSEDESMLYIGGQLGVAVIDLNTGRLVCQNENIAVKSGGAQILRSGKFLITASKDSITVWDPKNCFTTRELEPGGRVVKLLRSDSETLEAVIWDKNYTPRLIRWDFAAQTRTRSTKFPDDTTFGYWGVGKDKLMIQEKRGSRQLHFVNEKTGEAVDFIEEDWPRSLSTAAVAHDNSFAIAIASRELRFIDLQNKTSAPFATSDADVLSSAISPDNCTLATGSSDSSILLWRLPGTKCSRSRRPDKRKSRAKEPAKTKGSKSKLK